MAHKSREKSRVRFARVPQGTETCPFCLMLASRGAVYYSKETAGANSHYHPNCRCAIVPVWGNTQIEGYNPEEYYDRWKHPERYEDEKDAEEQTPLLKVAGVTQGKPMTFEQADKGTANPAYPDFRGLNAEYELRLNEALRKGNRAEYDRLYAEYRRKWDELDIRRKQGYSVNCQTCVVANEARRRGFNVEATPKTLGSLNDQLSRDTTLAWIDPVTGQHPQLTFCPVGNKTDLRGRHIATQAQFWEWLNSEGVIVEGCRYHITVRWRQSKGAHIICLERVDSGLRLFDPQSGETLEGNLARRYFDRVKFIQQRNRRQYAVGPELLRVDNLEFDKSMVDGILRESGTWMSTN